MKKKIYNAINILKKQMNETKEKRKKGKKKKKEKNKM